MDHFIIRHHWLLWRLHAIQTFDGSDFPDQRGRQYIFTGYFLRRRSDNMCMHHRCESMDGSEVKNNRRTKVKLTWLAVGSWQLAEALSLSLSLNPIQPQMLFGRNYSPLQPVAVSHKTIR